MRMPLFLFAILLLCSSCKKNDNNGNNGDEDTSGKYVWGTQPPLPDVSGSATLTIAENQDYVNVMGETMPRMPNFPQVAVKSGYLRGFVADLSGKPVKNAYVSVRSGSVVGSYTFTDDFTDDNGYYEFSLPAGATQYAGAGVAIAYGEQPGGLAALGLYPADGKLESVPTGGAIKNFVVLSNGLADASKRAQDPSSPLGYFGGTVRIEYDVYEQFWHEKGIPVNSQIEIKLTPVSGTTLYGETKSFTIIRKFGPQSILNFNITNIPIGQYTISARLTDGRQLKLTETGSNISLYPFHGLNPASAVGSTKLFFYPLNTNAKDGNPNSGPWRQLPIKVELP